MKSYSIAEAKSKFSEVIKTVEKGESATILRGIKKEEVAVIVPIDEWREAKKPTRKLGTLEGKMKVVFHDDWYMTTEEFLGYE
jgi:prevent-host-death family protein